MAFDTGQQNSTLSQINVVPLVDVMLVLLVIFMVTAPILQQGVAIDLPKTQASPLTGQDDQLVVSLDGDGNLYLNDEPIALEVLRDKLVAIARARPDRQVFLRADRGVPYGDVVKIMAEVRRAGVSSLGMVTELPETGE